MRRQGHGRMLPHVTVGRCARSTASLSAGTLPTTRSGACQPRLTWQMGAPSCDHVTCLFPALSRNFPCFPQQGVHSASIAFRREFGSVHANTLDVHALPRSKKRPRAIPSCDLGVVVLTGSSAPTQPLPILTPGLGKAEACCFSLLSSRDSRCVFLSRPGHSNECSGSDLAHSADWTNKPLESFETFPYQKQVRVVGV